MSNRGAAIRIMRGNRSSETPSPPTSAISPYGMGISPTVDEDIAIKSGDTLAPDKYVRIYVITSQKYLLHSFPNIFLLPLFPLSLFPLPFFLSLPLFLFPSSSQFLLTCVLVLQCCITVCYRWIRVPLWPPRRDTRRTSRGGVIALNCSTSRKTMTRMIR